jgi:hypothetical protein
VSELDGKGFARVALGLMSVRLAIEDLTLASVEGARVVLRSSHWRPNAAASGGERPAPQEPAGATKRVRSALPHAAKTSDVRDGQERSKKGRSPRRGSTR